MIDIGCGSGRWSGNFIDKAGFIDVLKTSEAIFAAREFLGKKRMLH